MGIKGTLKGITATTMIGAGLLGLGGVVKAATESVDLYKPQRARWFGLPEQHWRLAALRDHPEQQVARVHLHHPQCRRDVTDIQRWRDRR